MSERATSGNDGWISLNISECASNYPAAPAPPADEGWISARMRPLGGERFLVEMLGRTFEVEKPRGKVREVRT